LKPVAEWDAKELAHMRWTSTEMLFLYAAWLGVGLAALLSDASFETLTMWSLGLGLLSLTVCD